MGKTIGIDLGTSNSAGAVAFGKNEVVMIESKYGKSKFGKNFPSFVLFDHNGAKQMVGELAKAKLANNPKLVIWGVKRIVGLSYREAKERGELQRFRYDIEEGRDGGIMIKVGPEYYTPSHILGFILKEIKEDAENKASNPLIGGPIDKAVITVPAYFKATRTEPIIEAARQAGFTDIKIIPEPTAAAISYGLKIDKEATLLTFDLGGGTLDVTLLQIVRDEKGELISGELCTSGHEALGGVDMDELLKNYLITKCNLSHIEKDDVKMSMLRDEAERAKIRLSTKERTDVDLPTGACVELTRKELEDVLRPILDKCRAPIRLALQLAKLNGQDIDHILFVGGPTHMPCVREVVKSELESLGARKEVIEEIGVIGKEGFSINPMECVAQGASITSAGIMAPSRINVAEGYGTMLWPVPGLPNYYASIIPENSPCPIIGTCRIRHNSRRGLQVPVPLVAKRPDPDKSTPSNIVYTYVELGHFTISITPTGEEPLVDVNLRITDNKALVATLVHVQTRRRVTYENLNALSGEEKNLQDHTPPFSSDDTPDEQKDRQKDTTIEKPAGWSRKQLESLIHVAQTAKDLVPGSSRSDTRVMKKLGEIDLLIKGAVEANYRNPNDHCPDISNRIRELLNILFGLKVIKEKEFRSYLEQISKIAREF